MKPKKKLIEAIVANGVMDRLNTMAFGLQPVERQKQDTPIHITYMDGIAKRCCCLMRSR